MGNRANQELKSEALLAEMFVNALVLGLLSFENTLCSGNQPKRKYSFFSAKKEIHNGGNENELTLRGVFRFDENENLAIINLQQGRPSKDQTRLVKLFNVSNCFADERES